MGVLPQVLTFVHKVLHGRGGGASAARALGPALLGAAGRAVMGANRSHALPLLMDLCEALRPQVRRPPALGCLCALPACRAACGSAPILSGAVPLLCSTLWAKEQYRWC
jgi:hypothetical protein